MDYNSFLKTNNYLLSIIRHTIQEKWESDGIFYYKTMYNGFPLLIELKEQEITIKIENMTNPTKYLNKYGDGLAYQVLQICFDEFITSCVVNRHLCVFYDSEELLGESLEISGHINNVDECYLTQLTSLIKLYNNIYDYCANKIDF